VTEPNNRTYLDSCVSGCHALNKWTTTCGKLTFF